MRHLFVTQDFGPDLGGMARRHVEIARRLGTDTIVSTVGSANAHGFDAGEPYRVVREPFPFARANRFVNQIRWARHLAALCRGADVVHCGNVRPVGYAMYWAHVRTRVPYLLYVNGGDLLRERKKAGGALKRRTGAAIFARAAGIVATSDWVGELSSAVMHELGVRDAPPVRAIALGTDPAHFRPDADTGWLREQWGVGNAPLLLTVARLVRHKGQDTVIRALPGIAARHPEVRYVLVGEGEDQLRLRALAAELDVSDRVIFAGALRDQDLAEAYATATVYVGMSRLDQEINVEGFGISFLEASASGVPVVAGDSGGVRSAVRDGETGIVIPPGDVDVLVATVVALLSDSTLRERLGRSGRRAVETHFNWDRAAAETIAFAREVVAA